MEAIKKQWRLHQVINEAWENEVFKTELLKTPIAAIENLTGEKLSLPNGKALVVNDQTDKNTIYINIPPKPSLNDELSEQELEAVSGGAPLPTGPVLPWWIKIFT